MNESPLRPADTAELLQVWNCSAQFDPLSAELLHEKIWGDPDFQEPLAIGLRSDGALIGFAVAVLRERPAGRTGFLKLLAVAPQRQGQGHGKMLLQTLEQRLWQQQAAAVRPGESAPNYLTPGVDVRYTRAMLMFESLNYHRTGETYNLGANLAGADLACQAAQEQLLSRGIAIRRAARDDVDGTEALLAECWPAWRQEVAVAFANNPVTLHLAIAAGRVIGFAAHDSNNRGTAWFGPMGTHPDYRGSGVGQVLLRRCLADMQAAGHGRAIIPWVGPIRFYARQVGAEIDRVFYRYEKQRSH